MLKISQRMAPSVKINTTRKCTKQNRVCPAFTPCQTLKNLLYFLSLVLFFGEMAERLMALVLKTSDAERHRGFESLSLRHFY